MISIYTARTLLRTPSVDDLQDYLAYRNDIAPRDRGAPDAPVVEADAKSLLLAQQHRDLNEPGWLMLVVEDQETGRVIGEVGGFRAAEQMHRANIGWWLHPDARGQGIATEAVSSFIQWGFQDLGLELVDASCLDSNHRSHALMERLGMHREADTVRTINGAPCDERTYSLTRSAWIQRPTS